MGGDLWWVLRTAYNVQHTAIPWHKNLSEYTNNHHDMAESYTVPPQTRIGHVHLKVANLDRAVGFYRGVLGFQVTQYYGDSAVFLSAGGYHHHIGLNTWVSKEGAPPSRGTTGLYHLAILYPTRRDLAAIYKRLKDLHYPLDGASDHGVSQALYLRDPDNNGVELYWDRPQEEWPVLDGRLNMVTEPLHLEDLLKELAQEAPGL